MINNLIDYMLINTRFYFDRVCIMGNLWSDSWVIDIAQNDLILIFSIFMFYLLLPY